MNPQHCPICGKTVQFHPRYTAYLCSDCADKALSSDGRPLDFFNVSFSGGFIAYYAGTKDIYNSHVCFVDGIPCWADEARMGGIVIERLTPSEIRRAFDASGRGGR